MTGRHSVALPLRLSFSIVLAALTVPLLSACSVLAPFTPPAVRTADSSLTALTSELAAIPGVQDALATSAYDGSPSARSLTLRLFLDEPATAETTSVVTTVLEDAWAFDGFTPTSYRVEVWKGPAQTMPFDNTKRVDLAPLLDSFDLPGATVFKGALVVSQADMAARFGSGACAHVVRHKDSQTVECGMHTNQDGLLTQE